MKTLFDYCYYRVSRFYEAWGEKDGYFAGSAVVFLMPYSIILSLVVIVLHLVRGELTTKIILVTAMPYVIASAFYISKRRYNKLQEHYKNEKHRRLKGWLVFICILGAMSLFFISVSIFDVW